VGRRGPRVCPDPVTPDTTVRAYDERGPTSERYRAPLTCRTRAVYDRSVWLRLTRLSTVENADPVAEASHPRRKPQHASVSCLDGPTNLELAGVAAGPGG